MTSQEIIPNEPAPVTEKVGGRRRVGFVVLIVGLVTGLAAGVYFHGPIAHLLHGHAHDGTSAKGEAKQLWTCGMHPQVIQDGPGTCPICGMALEPVKEGAGATDGVAAERKSAVVHIDPVVVQNMGVRVAGVEKGPVVGSARVVGFLQEAQPNSYDVSLRVSGWVEKLHANTEGMLLKKGDPLFELYSPEIKVGIEELIGARKALAALPGNADPLARDSSQTLLDAAREKLRLWGLDEKEVDRLAGLERAPRTVVFRSPIDGNLIEKMIVEGGMVKMGERALRIVDQSTLWLDAQVFPQDLPFVRVGMKVEATVESQVGKVFEGEVVFIHPRVDPTTRTATVRVALPNPDLALRPGMYATAQVVNELTKDALLVPREAVIDTGDRQVAFVSMGNGHFEPRAVKLGSGSTEGKVQVLSGLAAGEQVVTSGQFLLDAESRMREAIQKHMHDKLLSKPSDPAPAKPPVVAGAGTSPQWRAAVDDVVAEYLKLTKRLGEVEKAKEPLDLTALSDAAGKLMAAAGDDAQKDTARQIAEVVAPLAKVGLDDQRKGFKPVSDRVIALADRYTPSAAVGQRLYVLHCSMAEGSWLQDSEEMANPYYARSMKKCAEVKRTVVTLDRG